LTSISATTQGVAIQNNEKNKKPSLIDVINMSDTYSLLSSGDLYFDNFKGDSLKKAQSILEKGKKVGVYSTAPVGQNGATNPWWDDTVSNIQDYARISLIRGWSDTALAGYSLPTQFRERAPKENGNTISRARLLNTDNEEPK
jgi:hypothetical protein